VKAASLDTLLRTFRRHLAAIRIVRATFLLLLVGGMMWAMSLPQPAGRRAMFAVVLGGLIAWIALLLNTMRHAREVQTSGILISTGQLDRGEQWLRRMITRFSFSVHAKILACQQLAALCFQRHQYDDVVQICRELLRHRLGRQGSLWMNTRLMLADTLLLLDRVGEAYESLRPIYNVPLPLSARMKLLPIQLRYELAADHAGSAVQDLSEKVQIAELLDSQFAALVHALLAEACRRQNMPAQSDFLKRRARLYHDLDSVVGRYAMIAPVVGEDE
jgi:hypothetical protein